MILDAMSQKRINADGLAFVEAHPDLEIFRLRIGKALNFKFNEDSQTLLFKRKDPRDGGPVLDIERGLISGLHSVPGFLVDQFFCSAQQA